MGGVFVIAFSLLFLPKAQAAPTLEQLSYRFYDNENAETPTDPWPAGANDLAENETITTSDDPPEAGDVIRIRMTVSVTGDPVAEGEVYKLQYAEGSVCSTIASFDWNDVSAEGGAGIWRGYNNATPTDGDTLASLLISDSDIEGTYEEENTATVPTGGFAVGETAEWDWVVEHNGAKAGASYCFRMVYSNDTEFDTYTDYPQLETKPFTPKSQNWRWYGDEFNETPTSSLSGENIQPIGVRSLNPIKLRFTIKETDGTSSPNQKFSLQFATNTNFTNAMFIDESWACDSNSLWCFADGVDNDGDAIANFLLTDSGVKGVHNESGTSTSSFEHTANSAVEYEFTIQGNGATAEEIYYFRAYDVSNGQSVPINTGEEYPSLKTFAQILEFSVTGISAGTTIDNWMTDVTSTATAIDFGTLIPNVPKNSAHRLTVSSDGLGYQILIRQGAPFQNGSGDIIPGIPHTNALPGEWLFTHSQSQSGAFGYHTTDDVLSDSSTRFQDDNTWAALTETGEEIVYTSGPIENDITDIVFRIEAAPIQPAGNYSADIIYIVSPTY